MEAVDGIARSIGSLGKGHSGRLVPELEPLAVVHAVGVVPVVGVVLAVVEVLLAAVVLLRPVFVHR